MRGRFVLFGVFAILWVTMMIDEPEAPEGPDVAEKDSKPVNRARLFRESREIHIDLYSGHSPADPGHLYPRPEEDHINDQFYGLTRKIKDE